MVITQHKRVLGKFLVMLNFLKYLLYIPGVPSKTFPKNSWYVQEISFRS